ncbi:MAG: hypothetical protein KDG44_18340, partial [Burkholderiaceae bacterium]|nr:hypothetical protein [Burkholderiaceae bacterium]
MLPRLRAWRRWRPDAQGSKRSASALPALAAAARAATLAAAVATALPAPAPTATTLAMKCIAADEAERGLQRIGLLRPAAVPGCGIRRTAAGAEAAATVRHRAPAERRALVLREAAIEGLFERIRYAHRVEVQILVRVAHVAIRLRARLGVRLGLPLRRRRVASRAAIVAPAAIVRARAAIPALRAAAAALPAAVVLPLAVALAA